MTQLTEADHGRAIAVRVGQAIDLTLPENATTGYRWIVAEHDAARLSVEPGPPDYLAARTGSGGTAHFRITARQPGIGRLRLRRGRSWEAAAEADKSFSVTIDAAP